MNAPKAKLLLILQEQMFQPVNAATLVLFRAVAGAILAIEILRFFAHGWIYRYWLEPTFHFTYIDADWLAPLPGRGMYALFAWLFLAALGVAFGRAYRWSAAVFCVGFTYSFLLEQARYLNHLYLVCLLSLVLACIPANRAFSLDARRRPSTRSNTVPRWSLWLLRGQIGLVYFFGGIAKLNADWLQGWPMHYVLLSKKDVPMIGDLLVADWMPYALCWSGALFDLLVFPALLWRRSRRAAMALCIAFNVTNMLMFNIGIFPWLMMASLVLFVEPDHPWLTRLAGTRRKLDDGAHQSGSGRRRLVSTLLAAYVAAQLCLPLRHFLYPGQVSWTEEGHRYAWHMKLRQKSGFIAFIVRDPDAGKMHVVSLDQHLQPWQIRKMLGHPDMILQFAHYLRDGYLRTGSKRVEVRVKTMCSLNGRAPQELVDPTVDLALVEASWRPKTWLVPLTTPLSDARQVRDRVRAGRPPEPGAR